MDRTRKIIKVTAAIFIIMAGFTSCSYINSCYNNLAGIYAADKGEYNLALTLFDSALTYYEKAEMYLLYNTATVYRDAGEYTAADKNISSINSGSDTELAYRINFERGFLAYRNNEYEKAANFFKKAVIIDNSDIKLLRNLELALLRIEEQNKDEKKQNASASSSQPAEADKKAESARILDFMFSGEVPFWLKIPEAQEESENTEKDW